MNFHLSYMLVLVVMMSVFVSGESVKEKPAADLLLRNGTFVTLDKAKPGAEAIAIAGGRILAVGSNGEMDAYRGKSTRVIDLKGKLAIPGFNDSHGHFSGLGRAEMQLNLRAVDNWDMVIDLVKLAAKNSKPGEWIIGRGWHQEKWNRAPVPNVTGLPVHSALSKISPQNPVLLTHASGHACFANAKAMVLAGIDTKSSAPDGGEIVKDSNGNPIGVFRENAMSVFYTAMNKQRANRTLKEIKEEKLKIISLAQKACLKNGVTSFQDAGSGFFFIDIIKELVKEKKLGVRLNVMISESNSTLARDIAKYRIIGLGDHFLTVRSIKRLLDGALGAHGAWLLKPYDSLPGSTGLNVESIASMKETAGIAIKNGFQFCTHAIGDRANREVLDIYEEAFKANPNKKDLRWRVEHAQHIHPTDIPRFGKLNVIAAMQGIHCTSDGPWVSKRLGDKRTAEGAYVWQKLMDSGAVICNGTDVPVESVDPIACFYASVSRKMKNGKTFYGSQRMSREEALRSYTINGAYASFEENIKGSLAPGKLADITILSKNIMTIPENEIPNTQVLYTIVGGKILFQAEKE
ncbi:MAG: amidohydrolase [bacterium]|nr:amidohydrolase [bacterium]